MRAIQASTSYSTTTISFGPPSLAKSSPRNLHHRHVISAKGPSFFLLLLLIEFEILFFTCMIVYLQPDLVIMQLFFEFLLFGVSVGTSILYDQRILLRNSIVYRVFIVVIENLCVLL